MNGKHGMNGVNGILASRWLLIALVALLLYWPMLMLVGGIFRSGAPGQAGEWTLAAVRRVIDSPATWKALGHSTVFALSTTFIGTLIGAFFAFISARTTAPLRGWLSPIMLLLFAVPPLLYAVSWSLLADPGAGLLNQATRAAFDAAPFNAFSWGGMVAVHSLKLSGFAYLMLLPPFRNMNRSYEEASMIAGAGRLATLLRIDLPLLLPAISGVVILGVIFGLGAFDVPALLGALAGASMLSTRIFSTLSISIPPDYAGASALGAVMMLMLSLLLALQWRLVRGERFVTVTGKSASQEPWDLGRWGYAAGALIVLFSTLCLLLPGVQLLLTSLQPAIGVNRYSLANYQSLLADRQVLGALRLTVGHALLCGAIVMGLALVMGQTGRRAPLWLRRYLEIGSLAPIMMPGVVLSIGLLWAFISLPGLRLLYGSGWLVMIGLVILTMPIASRIVSGALAQISRELEEAAQIAGAGPPRVLTDVTLQLVRRSFLAGWLVCGVVAAGTLDIPLMLLGPGTPNVSVLVYSDMTLGGAPTRASALLLVLVAVVVGLTALAVLTGAMWPALRRLAGQVLHGRTAVAAA